MNNGLKILIERMRERPADFDDRHDYTKNYGSLWLACMHEARALCEKKAFPDEDVQAFNEALDGLAVAVFEARVLDALSPPRPVQEPYQPEESRYGRQLGASMVATKNAVTQGLFSGFNHITSQKVIK
jgi:hypothetical protein